MGKTKQKQDRSHYLFSNRELANLIGPLVIEQLLAVFVGMADSIMVANVGEAAVSGVSMDDYILILFFIGLLLYMISWILSIKFYQNREF